MFSEQTVSFNAREVLAVTSKFSGGWRRRGGYS